MASEQEELMTKLINNEVIVGEYSSKRSKYMKAYSNGESAANVPAPISEEDRLWIELIEKGRGGDGQTITTEEVSVTPTKAQQVVHRSTGKYISKVTIDAIPDNYIEPAGSIEVTTNGTHDVTSYESVNVNVETEEPNLKIKAITANGIYKASDDGADGYSEVSVNIENKTFQPEGTIEITENGTHDVSDYASANVNVPIPEGYIKPEGNLEITENNTYDVTDKKNVIVNVPSEEPNLQEKTVTENGEVTADAGYDGLSKVLVNVAGSGGSGEDMLQAMVDATNKADYLFYGFGGNNIDFARNLDLSKITSAQYMLQKSSVTEANINFGGAATSLKYCCSSALSTTTINLSGTQNVTSMEQAFENSTGVQTVTIDSVDNVTNVTKMFNGCTKLTNVSDFKFGGKCASTYYMFYNCSSLANVPEIDMSEVTNSGYMFYGCKNIVRVPKLNTSKVGTMLFMFNGCTALETIEELDLESVYNNNSCFLNCSSLKNLTLKNIKKGIIIGSGSSYGHLLTVDSLVNTIKELVNTGSSLTLTMGSVNTEKLTDIYVKLTEDDGSGKLPFELCSSTDDGAMLIKDYVSLKNWVLA